MSEVTDAELVRELRTEDALCLPEGDCPHCDELRVKVRAADTIERLLAEKQAAIKERDEARTELREQVAYTSDIIAGRDKLIEENRVLRERIADFRRWIQCHCECACPLNYTNSQAHTPWCLDREAKRILAADALRDTR